MEVLSQCILRFWWVWQAIASHKWPKPIIVTWNWGLSICDMIPQIHTKIWCMYKFFNVEVTSNGDIIYNSRTRPSVGEVASLQGLVPNAFARLIIDKQDMAFLTTKYFFVVPKNDLYLFKEERCIHTTEPIHNHSLRSTPHKYQSTINVFWKYASNNIMNDNMFHAWPHNDMEIL